MRLVTRYAIRGRAISRASAWKIEPARAPDSPSSSSGRSDSPRKTNPDAPRPHTSAQRSTATKRTRVLVIEDDHTHASALRSILTRKNCDVTTAVTLAQGLTMLAAAPPDYVVLDLMLPDGHGIEVLRRLRADPECKTRVVVTTGVRDAAIIREVLALQPHRLLRKPVDLVDLLSAIGMM
ncbi:MAG: hypothetical protein QOF78_2701 [Phycisphaerales bacterium]|jgi:CheY-like chemotaxis protein|nr:hypothetical protein [Phycisphaerales bacterium]